MQNTTQQPFPPLHEYVGLPELVSQMRKELPATTGAFATVDSVRWFFRSHREDLAKRGAVINITGRLLFHPNRFQEAAVDIGRSALIPPEASHGE